MPTTRSMNTLLEEEKKQKQKTSLPYLQEGNSNNNQPLPIVKPDVQPLASQSTEIQKPVTPKIINDQNNPLTDVQKLSSKNVNELSTTPNTLASQGSSVQKLLNDPNMGYDYNKANKVALENYDANRSKSFEASRQALADIGNSGVNMEKLYKLGLQGNLERSTLEQDNQLKTNEAQRKAALDALTASGQYEQNKNNISQSNMQNLLNVGGLNTQKEMQQSQIGSTEKMNAQQLAVEQQKIKAQKEMQQSQIGSTEKMNAQQLAVEQQKIKAQKEMQEALLKNNINLKSMDIQSTEKLKNLDIATQKEIQNNLITAQKEMQQKGLDQALIEKNLDFTFQQQLKDQDFKNSQVLKNMDIKSQEELQKIDNVFRMNIQDKLLSAQKEMQATGISAEEQKASLDRTLQKELQAAQIAESLRQFDSKQKFDVWAEGQKMWRDDAQRLWASKERLANNMFALDSQQSAQEAQAQLALINGLFNLAGSAM